MWSIKNEILFCFQRTLAVWFVEDTCSAHTFIEAAVSRITGKASSGCWTVNAGLPTYKCKKKKKSISNIYFHFLLLVHQFHNKDLFVSFFRCWPHHTIPNIYVYTFNLALVPYMWNGTIIISKKKINKYH